MLIILSLINYIALTKSDFYRYDSNPLRQHQIIEEGYSRKLIGFLYYWISNFFRTNMEISCHFVSSKLQQQVNSCQMLSIQSFFHWGINCSLHNWWTSLEIQGHQFEETITQKLVLLKSLGIELLSPFYSKAMWLGDSFPKAFNWRNHRNEQNNWNKFP